MNRREALLAALSLGATPLAVDAQQFPSKPIHLIIPYAPGGSGDILMRPIANEMSKSLGKPVVIDYKPGANTTIGANFIARSAPDGHTLVVLLTAHAINATLMQNLPYDTVKDFSGITLAAKLPLVVVVNSQSNIRTLDDLIRAAKASPGKLNCASGGSAIQLAIELFKTTTGIDVTPIAYKGSGPAVTALMGQEVDFMIDTLSSSLAQIQGGRFRALAVTTAKRSSVLPQVPTVQEAGVPAFDTSLWYGIFAAAGTPPAIAQRLSAEIIKAMALPSVKDVIEGYGYQIVGSSPEQLDTFLKNEVALWGKVVRSSGIKLE